MTEETTLPPLLSLELPVKELPGVAQLNYQRIERRHVPGAEAAEALKRKVLSSTIDGDALALATALRDLQEFGIKATDESLTGPGGMTPLHMAVEANRPETLKVLIDHGCEVNALNRLGDAAVHVAAAMGALACLQVLGAPQALGDFALADAEGRTPADLARQQGHAAAAALLAELQATDAAVHMVRRRNVEAARQRLMVRTKERLYGRPLTSLEGGPDFRIPARAALDDASSRMVCANVRAFASCGPVLEAATKRAIAHFTAAAAAEAKAEVEARRGQGDERRTEGVDENEAKGATRVGPLPVNRAAEAVDEAANEPAEGNYGASGTALGEGRRGVSAGGPTRERRLDSSGESSWDIDDEEDNLAAAEFIPGRIASSRWIDLSRGRPPDVGYLSCV